ncbi:MAG: hypothetical protein ACLFO2_02085 [Candidatus Woesearchaeota archaeon]
MAMRKKGVAYLLLSLIFVTLLGTVYLTQEGYDHEDHHEATAARVGTMNSFIGDLHHDLDRAAYISGYRALLGMEEHLSQRGAFFDNQSAMEEAFRQAFLTGGYNGTSFPVLDNASFNDYLQRVDLQASQVGIDVNATVARVRLSQAKPWVVQVRFQGNFTITDERGAAWWEYTKNFTTDVPITGLKDPLYTVNTNGRVPNTITNHTLPPTGYVNDTNNDTAVLREFTEGSYYRTTDEAPSFLQRFTGDLAADEHGIESLVYLPALSDQGVVVHTDRSVVDHIYFSSSPDNSTDRCDIQGMSYTPDWFRLDQDHMDDYELDTLSSTSCG